MGSARKPQLDGEPVLLFRLLLTAQVLQRNPEMMARGARFRAQKDGTNEVRHSLPVLLLVEMDRGARQLAVVCFGVLGEAPLGDPNRLLGAVPVEILPAQVVKRSRAPRDSPPWQFCGCILPKR